MQIAAIRRSAGSGTRGRALDRDARDGVAIALSVRSPSFETILRSGLPAALAVRICPRADVIHWSRTGVGGDQAAVARQTAGDADRCRRHRQDAARAAGGRRGDGCVPRRCVAGGARADRRSDAGADAVAQVLGVQETTGTSLTGSALRSSEGAPAAADSRQLRAPAGCVRATGRRDSARGRGRRRSSPPVANRCTSRASKPTSCPRYRCPNRRQMRKRLAAPRRCSSSSSGHRVSNPILT